jgi:hypothetical protein
MGAGYLENLSRNTYPFTMIFKETRNTNIFRNLSYSEIFSKE